MGFMDFLGGGVAENPYSSNKAAFDQYGQEMDQAAARYNPYFDRGNQAGEAAFNAYSRDVNDPNYIQDKAAAGYNTSPFQQMLLDQITKRMNYNSANSGMQGSGAANRALMEELTKNTGQFQNDYVNRSLGVYSKGLDGLDKQQDFGLRAGEAQDELKQEGAGGRLKGAMSENETNDRNNASNSQRGSNIFGSIVGIGGGIAGNLMGGPMGGSIGSTIGQYAGNMFGGQSQGGYSPSQYMGNKQYSNNQYNTGSYSY